MRIGSVASRGAVVAAAGIALLAGAGGTAMADESRNGPWVWNTGDTTRSAVVFYADSSPNGTGDTLRVDDYVRDGHSAIGLYYYATTSTTPVWNTKGGNTSVYAVLGGGVGLPEGSRVYYKACWGDTSNKYEYKGCTKNWASGYA